MVIQHNLPAMNAHRNLGINNAATSKNLEKLSSGYRINRAADDAAGLAISEKMRGQIRGLAMATQNAQNGVSLIQTAEGGLNETHAILQRMRELAVQSANGTYDDDVDRANIAKEVQALKSEIDRIATSTNYNGIKLLDGSMGSVKVASATDVTDALGVDLTLTITNAELLKMTDATLTIDTSYIDENDASGVLISLQIGDKTYTNVNGGADLYLNGDDSDLANKIGSISGTLTSLKSGVINGLDLTKTNATTGALLSAIGDGGRVAGKTSELVFQIGANGTADQRVGLHVDNMSSGNIGTKVYSQYNSTGTISGINVGTREAANDAIAVIDAATNQVSGTRADLGALQNRLEHTINNLGVTRENLQAAESSIRDVDMAKEMMEFTKNNILVQASQAMLAQANQLPQGVLQLLR